MLRRINIHEQMKNGSGIEEKKSLAFSYLKELLIVDNESVFSKDVHDNFFAAYFRFWKQSNRTEENFLRKHGVWLSKEISFNGARVRQASSSQAQDATPGIL